MEGRDSDREQYLRSLVIYEVYVRNHGAAGTFAEVEADLERIRSLGVDVVWLMPIHPIGRVSRKGSLGSPYSIADYRAINPEYGSIEDFGRLVARTHELGMKLMIDVVYNHTALDSVLVADHPAWYHLDASGRPMTTVPEWSDVIDLAYPNRELEDYLLASLREWSRLGVDGFRCDVAPLVPIEFWMRARTEIGEINPRTIWLAESVHAAFVEQRRTHGLRAHGDAELYAAFDLEYDYELWPVWQAAVRGLVPVRRYLELLRMQRVLYPAQAVKMRCVENHDQLRIMELAEDRELALAWSAFEAFNDGALLLYAGQEAGVSRTPSLFDRDPIEWGDYELAAFTRRLAALKKEPAVYEGSYAVASAEPVVQVIRRSLKGCLLGLFDLEADSGGGQTVEVELPDGDYQELLSEEPVEVRGGRVRLPRRACVLRAEAVSSPRWFYSELFDYAPTLSHESQSG